MMKYYDAAVIGGGILGCFAARNLRKWNISTALLEVEDDVCTGISKASTAVVYAGYDNKPGTLKAQMTVRANRNFDQLCQELGVSFSRCGSLMVSSDPLSDMSLKEKYEQGQENGVPALNLLSGDEARRLEPTLSSQITSALFAPTTGTVNPWHLCYAAYENAKENGAEFLFNTKVIGIESNDTGYEIKTNGDSISCKVIINCAGLYADQIQEMCFPPSVRIVPDGADYLVMDKNISKPKHIIFQETPEKGTTFVPTIEGTLLVGATSRPLKKQIWATSLGGITELKKALSQVLPQADTKKVIRSFASVRPHPYEMVKDGDLYVMSEKNIGNFVISHPGPGFYSFIGIKTPGLTCAEELGHYVAQKAAEELHADVNNTFNPHRVHKKTKDHNIICLCEQITRGEIIDAIRRGAKTVDGIKRRAGSGLGPCQGGRCAHKIEQLLEEYERGTV